jgi:hypothetical protein
MTRQRGPLVVFSGGIPLVRDRKIMGAIGVSIGTIEQDEVVASRRTREDDGGDPAVVLCLNLSQTGTSPRHSATAEPS